MPLFRIQGRDIYHQQERVLFVDGADVDEVRAFARSRGIEPTLVAGAQLSDVPVGEGVGLQRVPSPETKMEPRSRRKILLAMGVGLGLFTALGILFVFKAKDHLTREKPNQPAPTWQRAK